MDISMPIMSGEDAYDAIIEICAKQNWKTPRFIFCTGFVVSDRLKEIVGDGSEHSCLSKPLTINALLEAVRGCLAPASVT